MHATRAAVETGIVPGGGVALLRSLAALDGMESELSGDETFAVALLRRALQAPLRAIARNAGAEGSVVVDDVLSSDDAAYGYDARTHQYVDMFEAGIVDPAKVTRSAVQNAVSVSGTMLTTRVMVTELKDADADNLVTGAIA